jgi:hypothetical protein
MDHCTEVDPPYYIWLRRAYLGLGSAISAVATDGGVAPRSAFTRPNSRSHHPPRRQAHTNSNSNHLRLAVLAEGLSAAAAVFAISASVSLLKPATPTAPTTAPFTRIGMPPRSTRMPAVTKAVRP